MHIHHFPVTLLGRTAQNVLATMQSGHITAAFQRSFYVESDRGELICFGAAAMDAGPLNALCELPEQCMPRSLEPGVRVEKRGDDRRPQESSRRDSSAMRHRDVPRGRAQ